MVCKYLEHGHSPICRYPVLKQSSQTEWALVVQQGTWEPWQAAACARRMGARV